MTGPSNAPDAADSADSGDDRPPVPVASTRTRRLVLISAAALLVLLGGGAAAMALTGGTERDGDDPQAAVAEGADPPAEAIAPPVGVQTVPPVPPSGVPPGQLEDPVPPDDAYRPVPALCEEGDFSPVFDIVVAAETLNDHEEASSSFYRRECTFRLEGAGSLGTFEVNVAVYDSADEAQGWFDDILAAQARGESPEELAGDWDAAAVLAPADGPDQADVRFLARDETLLLNLRTFIVGDAADEQAQQAAMVEVATLVRDGMLA